MFTELINLALENLLYFALHLESGGVFPKPLSAAEEEECFRKMHEGDKAAKNKLIEHNLRLVAHIIKKYYNVTTDQEDLISIGTIGLIKAVSTFDYSKKTRFATYASRCIENEILMHFRSLKKSAGDVYFDEPIDTDKEGNQLTLIDIIAEDDGILDKIDLSIKSEQLYRFIGECLDEREITVIKHRYGLYGCAPRTQREVADKLGISRSYVSRIEKKALQTLKKKYDKTSIFSSSVHSGTSVSAGAGTAKRKEKSDLK
ncbi:MAG: RNA polymerase sporulation sigma factor SigK [Oscillospiraceae bacterium]|nr:RNA polymerase sporulation sigma factor SigK [Oscillospiraceae bacterium]